MKEEWQSKFIMSKLPHGRPSECTPEAIEKFCAARRDGLPLDDCAILAGVGLGTHKDWFRRGRNYEEPYYTFCAEVKKAEAQFKQERINLIKASHDGDPKNWVASMTLLERLFHADFGRNQSRINFDLPSGDGTDIDKLNQLSNTIIDQIANGEMTVESGNLMLNALDNRRKLIETCDHEQRIKATEEALKQRGA